MKPFLSSELDDYCGLQILFLSEIAININWLEINITLYHIPDVSYIEIHVQINLDWLTSAVQLLKFKSNCICKFHV